MSYTEVVLVSVIFPSLLQQPSWIFFLPVKLALPKKKLRRLLSAAPSRRDLSAYVYFLRFATQCGTSSGAVKRGLFAVYVDCINIISWSKREVGPMLYVTELGTLESATAPLADCVPMLSP